MRSEIDWKKPLATEGTSMRVVAQEWDYGEDDDYPYSVLLWDPESKAHHILRYAPDGVCKNLIQGYALRNVDEEPQAQQETYEVEAKKPTPPPPEPEPLNIRAIARISDLLVWERDRRFLGNEVNGLIRRPVDMHDVFIVNSEHPEYLDKEALLVCLRAWNAACAAGNVDFGFSRDFARLVYEGPKEDRQ